MHLVIIAGGLGTRMQNWFPDTPKLLLKLATGDTVLTNLLNQIKPDSFSLCLGHMSQKIEEYVLKKHYHPIISKERYPLGTFGALKKLVKDNYAQLPEKLLVILGDLNCSGFAEFQRQNIKKILVNQNNYYFYSKNKHPHDSDCIEINLDNEIRSFYGKAAIKPKFVNKTLSGMYLLMRDDILNAPINEGDLVTQFLPELMRSHRVYAERVTCDLLDIGTPERYQNLGNIEIVSPRGYLLMDLDGTLIKDRGSSKLAYDKDIEITEEGLKVLKLARNAGRKIILITNKGDIAKGFLTYEHFFSEIALLEEKLFNLNLSLDDIRYCPHHPDKGFSGELASLKISCECRKPNTGMWKELEETWGCSKKNSIMVGDTSADENFAKNVGLKYFSINGIFNSSANELKFRQSIKI